MTYIYKGIRTIVVQIMVSHGTMKKCHFRSKFASVYTWNLCLVESESSVFFSEKRNINRKILNLVYQIILGQKKKTLMSPVGEGLLRISRD